MFSNKLSLNCIIKFLKDITTGKTTVGKTIWETGGKSNSFQC
jgi:hypothetical protein